MKCKQLIKWLEETKNGGPIDNLPPKLRTHLDEEHCQTCQKLFQRLKKEKETYNSLTLNPRSFNKIKAKITSKTLSLNSLNKKQINWLSYFKWSLGGLTATIAILTILYTSWTKNPALKQKNVFTGMKLRDFEAKLAKNKSKSNVYVSPHYPSNEKKPNTNLDSPNTKLAFAATDKIELHVKACGTIKITGSGTIQITNMGFKAYDGYYTASFNRKSANFNIFVNNTRLEIQGTTISFNLSKGKGLLKLIEGKVKIFKFKHSKPILWTTKQVLNMNGNNIKLCSINSKVITPNTTHIQKKKNTTIKSNTQIPDIANKKSNIIKNTENKKQEEEYEMKESEIDVEESTSSGNATFGVSGPNSN